MKTLLNPYSETTTWVYDALSRPTSQELGNTTKTTYSYDDAGRLTGITNKKSGGTVISSFTYTYDDAGNRKTVTENNGDIVTWTYDASDRLTREKRNGTNS